MKASPIDCFDVSIGGGTVGPHGPRPPTFISGGTWPPHVFA